MLLVEENHVGASTSTHADNKMFYTDKVSLRAMEATDVSNEEGIVVMPTAIWDPLKAGGVEPAQKTSKGNPSRNVGVVARKATRRVSVGRRALIHRNLDPNPDELNKEISSGSAFVMRHEANSMKKTTPKLD